MARQGSAFTLIRPSRVCVAAVPAILWLSLSPAASADTPQDYQTWTRFSASHDLGFLHPGLEKFRFWFDTQARFGENSSTLSQWLVRPGLGYSLNRNASLWLGYYHADYDPDTPRGHIENRSWEQFLWEQPTDLGRLSIRNRLEQRFRAGSNAQWRFRQQIKLTHPLDFAPGYSLVVSDEWFVNPNKTKHYHHGLDQNRLFLGFAYKIDRDTSFQIGYMLRYDLKQGSPDVLKHILRLSIDYR